MFNWVVCRDANWGTPGPSQSLTMQTALSFNMLCLTTSCLTVSIRMVTISIIRIICLRVPIDSLGWGHRTNWSLTWIIHERAIDNHFIRNLFTIDRDYGVPVVPWKRVSNSSWTVLCLTSWNISDKSVVVAVLRLLYWSTLIVVVLLRLFLMLIFTGELAKRR